MIPSSLPSRLTAVRTAIAVRERLLSEREADFTSGVRAARDGIARRVRAERAHKLLTAFADSRREVVRAKIEAAVGAAIKAVFGPRHSFRLDVRTVRGQVAMEPQIGYRRGAAVEWVGMDSVGGGVADVVSFALRVSILARYRPGLRRVLVADEPFKHVSETYLPRVAVMLRELSRSAGVQLIIVSHEPEIAAAADRVYDVSMGPNGRSRATRGDQGTEEPNQSA